MAVPVIYRICVEGRLDLDWAEWFEGMAVTHDTNGQTYITGPVCDQAALYGILAKLRDLCLTLISVSAVEGGYLQREGFCWRTSKTSGFFV